MQMNSDQEKLIEEFTSIGSIMSLIKTPNTACTDEVGSQGYQEKAGAINNAAWNNITLTPSQECAKRCLKLYNDVERRARKTPSRVSNPEFMAPRRHLERRSLTCFSNKADGARDGSLRAPGNGGEVSPKVKTSS
jgi:hypothetical protein